MVVSGYSLELYCDYENPQHPYIASPDLFFDESKRVAWASARRAGWKFVQREGEGTLARCPMCVKAKITTVVNDGRGW